MKGIAVYGGRVTGEYTVVIDTQVWSMTWTISGHEFDYLGKYGDTYGRAELRSNPTWGKKLSICDLSLIARESLAQLLGTVLRGEVPHD